MNDDILTSHDRLIVRKLVSDPPQPLSEEDRKRLRVGNGLLFRVTKSWDAQDDAIRAVVAMQTVTELQRMVPRMVQAFEKLVQLEERREQREDARVAGIWGNKGLVPGIIGILSTLAGAAATYFAMGAGG